MAESRRGLFLINRKFQIRFSAYVCSWILAISFVYPLITYSLFEYAARVIGVEKSAAVNLDKTRVEVLWLLILFQIVLLVLTFLVSIFMSHRIAGPVYKMTRALRDASQGRLQDDLQFREKDHFRELADEYNIMIRGIRQSVDKKSGAVLSAIPLLEKALQKDGAEAKADIEAALAALRGSAE